MFLGFNPRESSITGEERQSSKLHLHRENKCLELVIFMSFITSHPVPNGPMERRTSAGRYRRDTASRFSLTMVSITTSKTTSTLEVSVAVVKWW